jgi:hypothetical protein
MFQVAPTSDQSVSGEKQAGCTYFTVLEILRTVVAKAGATVTFGMALDIRSREECIYNTQTRLYRADSSESPDRSSNRSHPTNYLLTKVSLGNMKPVLWGDILKPSADTECHPFRSTPIDRIATK